jgi:hypothetical protein
MIQRIEKKLGKLLFPRSERWKQQQRARVFLVITLIQIVAVGVLVYIFHRGDRWQ